MKREIWIANSSNIPGSRALHENLNEEITSRSVNENRSTTKPRNEVKTIVDLPA